MKCFISTLKKSFNWSKMKYFRFCLIKNSECWWFAQIKKERKQTSKVFRKTKEHCHRIIYELPLWESPDIQMPLFLMGTILTPWCLLRANHLKNFSPTECCTIRMLPPCLYAPLNASIFFWLVLRDGPSILTLWPKMSKKDVSQIALFLSLGKKAYRE